MSKTFTCICCPRGCSINVTDSQEVSGNFCPRGKTYALSELSNPVRILTSTVKVSNRNNVVVSVRTSCPIPKDKVLELNKELLKLTVKAPIKIGDIIWKNPMGIDVDIISTKNIE